jgi:gliding motility-associated-like protein
VWNWGGGVVQNGSGFGPYDVRYQQTGNIGLTVTDGACTVTATPVTVQAIPVPVVDFSADLLTGCAPAAITFTNTSRFADTYQWSFGNGQQATTTHPVYNYGTPGTYTVTLTATAQGQCSNTITKTGFITILAPPIAAFSAQPGENRPVEFKNGNFSFTNGSQYAISYEWDFGDGTTSILTNPAHKYQLPGSYRVLLYAINDIGCRDSISHAWYVVTADLILDIPNAFSPNGDGTNDRWNIDGLKARPNATTEVYNRWGQLVYKSIGYTGGWDGTRGGKPLPAGTYYYVIKTAADEKPYTGWVALLR